MIGNGSIRLRRGLDRWWIIDPCGAGLHLSGELAVPDKITIVSLPPKCAN
jgi:hypothetical protein